MSTPGQGSLFQLRKNSILLQEEEEELQLPIWPRNSLLWLRNFLYGTDRGLV
jgi:hypothetical protein